MSGLVKSSHIRSTRPRVHTETWNSLPPSSQEEETRATRAHVLRCWSVSVYLSVLRRPIQLHTVSTAFVEQAGQAINHSLITCTFEDFGTRQLVVIRCCKPLPCCTQPTCTHCWLLLTLSVFVLVQRQGHRHCISRCRITSPRTLTVRLYICWSACLPIYLPNSFPAAAAAAAAAPPPASFPPSLEQLVPYQLVLSAVSLLSLNQDHPDDPLTVSLGAISHQQGRTDCNQCSAGSQAQPPSSIHLRTRHLLSTSCAGLFPSAHSALLSCFLWPFQSVRCHNIAEISKRPDVIKEQSTLLSEIPLIHAELVQSGNLEPVRRPSIPLVPPSLHCPSRPPNRLRPIRLLKAVQPQRRHPHPSQLHGTSSKESWPAHPAHPANPCTPGQFIWDLSSLRIYSMPPL